MKSKLFLIAALTVCVQSTINIASEKHKISFGPKLYNLHEEKRYAPSTYARIKLQHEDPIPEGYVKVKEPSYYPLSYPPYARQYDRPTHVGPSRIYQKKLPVSGKHEYYNQFIEGYEPTEEFEKKMISRASVDDQMKNRSIWKKHRKLKSSQEYMEQKDREKERLLKLEKESRPKPPGMSDPEFWDRVEERIKERNRQEREQSYWYRFTNWLRSIKNPFSSTPTSQPIYTREYSTTKSNRYPEPPIYE